jgi:hypothetical protein
VALDAYSRFGKARHPVALNFGGCTCATASIVGKRLLCIGDDFRRSALDVGQALRNPPRPDSQQISTSDMPVRPAVEPPDDDPIARAEHLLDLKM